MTVSIGTRIGPFEIGESLGAGGMGEVYRARDTRLGRDVAIKMLPASFAHDTARRARFEREARVLASLNHPNIATLYGIEEASGEPVLVMELIQGETLADRLALGGATNGPLREILSIAEQMAAALDAAHEHGIVHGDLKPSNVMVRLDGTVKVLDFGLARTLESDRRGGTESPGTVTLTDAAPGVGPGTPAYMSPEQARGLPTDTRADVWTFGCVLYELLTGTRPFGGDRLSDVLARILERDPDFGALPSETPAPVRRLLRRCLEKDSRDRLRDLGDARLEIRDALRPASETSSLDRAHARGTGRRRWHAAAVAALALLTGVGGWLAATLWTPPPQAPVVRLSIPSLQAPFQAPFGEHHLAISSDGSRVAYASASRLLIRRMDERETVTIDIGASNPFFSADDEWLGFFVRGGDLQKVPVRGGAPVTIAAITGRPNGGTWRADGTIVFATSEGLYQVPGDGGDATLLMNADASRRERAYASPHFMPDGRSLLFTIVPEGSIDGARIAVLDLSTRAVDIVLSGGSAARYVSAGHLIYASGQSLKAVAFDRDTRRIRGEPVSLPDVAVSTAPDNGVAEFAVSEAGTLIFIAPIPGGPLSALWWVDRNGREEPLPLEPGQYLFPRVSPDGTRVAVDIPGANRDVWVWSAQRPGLIRLTRGPAEDMLPAWSRDGRLFFASQRSGNFDLYSQAADGSTPERVEFSGPGDQMPNGFTPDGTRLIVNENFRDLSVLTLTHPPRLEPLLHSEANEWLGEVSPDAKWLAYESDESGDRFEIFLRPFPDVTARRERVSIAGGRYPMWAPDGSGELFYVDLNGSMMAASITLSPALVLGPVTKLFDVPRPPRVITARPYDVSPRDGRFLVTRPAAIGPNRAVDITVIVNWVADLRRIVPGH
jgi:eukaryotic-like serine/threonine-protein kinase